MRVTRPTVFWVGIAVVAIVMLALLHQILMPFVLGMLTAYLLVPILDRLERAGPTAPLRPLCWCRCFIVAFVAIILVIMPFLISELRFFIASFPAYVTRIQSLLTDANTSWLRSIAGHDLRIEQSAIDFVTSRSSAWLDDLLRSLWSGGQVLIWLLSLLVVAPIVAIYLLIDWHRMIATLDVWFPQLQRDDVRRLARDIHDAVAGFMRGQLIICIILAVFYATALRLTGLSHALVIGIAAGTAQFRSLFRISDSAF